MRRAHRLLLSTAAGLTVGFAASTSFALSTVRLTMTGAQPPEISDESFTDALAVSRRLLGGSGNKIITGAVAAGAADLRSGTLRVFAQATIVGANPNGLTGGASAAASFTDAIVVTGPGPTANVLVTLEVGGAFTLSGPDGSAQQTVDAQLSFGTKAISMVAVRNYTHTTGSEDVDSLTINPQADPSVMVTGASPSNVLVLLRVQVDVNVGSSVRLSGGLQVDGKGRVGYAMVGDFGNTARLSLVLPDGYAFTSTSGVLLSQAGAPGTPLPAEGEVGVGGDGGAPVGAGTNVDGGNGAPPSATPGDAGASAAPSGNGGGCNASGLPSVAATGILCGLGLLAMGWRSRGRRRT